MQTEAEGVRQAPSVRLLRSSGHFALAAALLAVLIAGALLAVDTLLLVDEPAADTVRTSAGTDFWRLLTEAGSQRIALLVSVVLGSLLWRRCRALAIGLPLAVVGGILVDVGLKYVVGRARPDGALIGTALSSFPSGHVITAGVLFGLIPLAAYVLTRRRWAFWVSAAMYPAALVGVALSRVALGAHWPTDVAASLVIALLIVSASEASVLWAGRRINCACPLHAGIDAGSTRRQRVEDPELQRSR